VIFFAGRGKGSEFCGSGGRVWLRRAELVQQNPGAPSPQIPASFDFAQDEGRGPVRSICGESRSGSLPSQGPAARWDFCIPTFARMTRVLGGAKQSVSGQKETAGAGPAVWWFCLAGLTPSGFRWRRGSACISCRSRRGRPSCAACLTSRLPPAEYRPDDPTGPSR